MSRIDIPTLQCDRCELTTTNIGAMGEFWTIRGTWDGYGSTREAWDLCHSCTGQFKEWMKDDR